MLSGNDQTPHCPLADANATRASDTARMGAETRIETIGIIGAAISVRRLLAPTGGRAQQGPDGAFLGRNLVQLP
jgi:hypothetical protein